MKHSYLQHPSAILRVGGVCLADASLPAGIASALHREARDLRREYEGRKPGLCAAIAAELPRAYGESQKTGRDLLELKRRFFNARLPSGDALGLARRFLAARDGQEASRAAEILEALAGAEKMIDEAHQRAIVEASNHALSIACERNIGRAIEITNPDAYRRLMALRTSAASFSRKERAQLHVTAARYVLRAGHKTSPLSSMGIVALGSWSCGDDREGVAGGAVMNVAGPIEHEVQFRHAALQSVAATLRRSFVDLGSHAQIVLNPSLRIRDARSSWLMVRGGDPPEWRVRDTDTERNTSEAVFIRVLQRIFAAAGQDAALTVGELDAAVASILPGSDARARAGLLGTAWDRDLLRLDTGAADDPIGGLRCSIAALADPHRRQALERDLDAMTAALADPADPAMIRHAEAGFETLLQSASIAEPVTRYRPVLFEDCRITEPGFTLPAAWQSRLRPSLERLLDLVPILSADSPLNRMRRIMVARFVDAFGRDGRCDDPLSFLTAGAEHMDSLFAARKTTGADPLEFSAALDDSHAAMLDLQRSLLTDLVDRVRQAGPDAAEIRIAADAFARYAQAMPASAWPRELSQMFFVQPCRPDGTQRFVLNQIYPGASSTFSRFIPDTPDRRAVVRDYLSELAGGRPFVELAGGFGFNAAGHPRFADARVSVAPFGRPGDGTVPLERFGLRHRADSDDLVFVDPDGNDVSIFYPAILTPFLTPRVHQLVRITASWIELVGDISATMFSQLPPSEDGITRLPRIVFGDLVIARRAFAVPLTALPDPLADPVAFFRQFTDWADGHALPRWLFARRRGTVAGIRSGEAAQGSRTKAAKPLPLDRDCPLSVRIFQKDLAASGSDIVLTEALPSPEDAQVTHNGRPTVGELGIELSRIIQGDPA